MLYTVNSPRNQADLQPLLYPTHHACEQVPGEDGKKLAGEASRRARNPKNSESEAWGFVRRILFFLRSPACSKAIPVLVFGLWLFY